MGYVYLDLNYVRNLKRNFKDLLLNNFKNEPIDDSIKTCCYEECFLVEKNFNERSGGIVLYFYKSL